MDYENKRALPNKALNEDGDITDLFGNPVVATSEAYRNKPSLPNKWLNPDGTYSTLTELIAGAIDTDVFVIVDELPAEGNPKKIYLVPDGDGGFNEYHYINGKWDPVGNIDMSISPQVFYWDGNTQQAGLDFWNNIYQLQKTQPCLVYTRYIQDNVPIIQHWIYNNDMPTSTSDTAVVYSVYTPSSMKMIDNSYTRITRYTCQLYFTITDDQVTAINRSTHIPANIDFIQITTGYSRAFTPSLPVHPATKKYVDDSISNSYVNIPIEVINLNDSSTPEEIFAAFGGKQKLQDIIVELRKGKYAHFVDINEEYIEDEQPHLEIVSSLTSITRYSIENIDTHLIEIRLAWRDEYVHYVISLGIGYEDDELTIISDDEVGISRIDLEFALLENVLEKENTTPFTPTDDYNPATKKYVDDKIANSITLALGGEY